MIKHSVLIQSDFDNTITIGNVSEQIHDKFGPPEWDFIYKDYKNGKISVEQSNILSFKNLKYSKYELDIFVKKVRFREGFLEFYNYINDIGIDFKIVSSGVDFYILSSLISLGINIDNIPIMSGNSTFDDQGIQIKYYDPLYNIIESDFKLTYTNTHRDQYSEIIYLGYSLTDLDSSLKADYVFATDKLNNYYAKNNLKCFEFHNFHDVLEMIKNILN